jgi:UDP-glucose 4-epimerase
LFIELVKNNQPLTVTLPEMTRFLLSLERAVDTVLACLSEGQRGETYIPKVKAAKITDVAKALMGEKDLPITFTGIRPGEKIHEIMVSEEEIYRTIERKNYYVILPVLPEIRSNEKIEVALTSEYSSKDDNISVEELKELLAEASDEIKQFLNN